jgi:hypothetical protein
LYNRGGGRNFLPSEMRGGRGGAVDLYVNQSVKRRARLVLTPVNAPWLHPLHSPCIKNHGFAPRHGKRTPSNDVLGQAGCTVSLRPKTTELGGAARLDDFTHWGLGVPRSLNGP